MKVEALEAGMFKQHTDGKMIELNRLKWSYIALFR